MERRFKGIDKRSIVYFVEGKCECKNNNRCSKNNHKKKWQEGIENHDDPTGTSDIGKLPEGQWPNDFVFYLNELWYLKLHGRVTYNLLLTTDNGTLIPVVPYKDRPCIFSVPTDYCLSLVVCCQLFSVVGRWLSVAYLV